MTAVYPDIKANSDAFWRSQIKLHNAVACYFAIKEFASMTQQLAWSKHCADRPHSANEREKVGYLAQALNVAGAPSKFSLGTCATAARILRAQRIAVPAALVEALIEGGAE